jgi:hypothetical protein
MRKVMFKYFIPGVRPQKEGGGTDYSKWVEGTNCYSDLIPGYFHTWGYSTEEVGDTVASYSIGIIEGSDGVVREALPSNVLFVDTPTTPEAMRKLHEMD